MTNPIKPRAFLSDFIPIAQIYEDILIGFNLELHRFLRFAGKIPLWSVTFGPKSVETNSWLDNFFELTTPTMDKPLMLPFSLYSFNCAFFCYLHDFKYYPFQMCQNSTNFKEMSPQGLDIKDKVEIACVNASILATSFAFLFPDWPHGQNGSPFITWEKGAFSSDSDVSDITGWPEWMRPSTVHEKTRHKHEPDREIQAEG